MHREQRIHFLESEVDRLARTLKDCEGALDIANSQTEKANKVARDAKAKVVELDARVYQIEGELKEALERASGFEKELRTYRAKYSEAKSTISEKDSVIGGKEGTISSLADKVCPWLLLRIMRTDVIDGFRDSVLLQCLTCDTVLYFVCLG